MLLIPILLVIALLLAFVLAAAYFALGQFVVCLVRRQRQPPHRPQLPPSPPR